MDLGIRLLAAALAALAQSGKLKPEPPFKAIAEMSGANSSIETPRILAVTDSAGWNTIWAQHHSTFQVGVPAAQQDVDPERPKIDFTNIAVLCLFGGASRNVGAFTVSDSGNEGDHAVIKLEPKLLPDTGTAILQNPYIFIEVPRTRRKIVVELDQVPLGGQGWRILATFDSLKN